MSIRRSLLALLSECPRHGYELKSEFDRRTGNSWPLNIGQVYTTLDRLERDALVVRGDEDADGRVAYSITPAGLADVEEWFSSPVAVVNPPRNELAIKLALAVTMSGIDVTALVQQQRKASLRALQDYTRARQAANSDDLAWQLIIERLIFDTEAEVRWLDHCESAAVRASRRTATAQGTHHSPTPKRPHAVEGGRA